MENEFNSMEEIDLREILHMIRKRWWIITLCLCTAIVSSLIVNYKVLIPVYRAETTLFAGKEPNRLASIDIGDLNLNQKLVVDYREIILSRLVAEQVIKDVNVDMKTEDFRKRVSVSTIRDSRFFKISFESSDPKIAMDVANALAGEVIEKAKEIIDINNVVVIDEAELPQSPIKPNKKLNTAIAGVLGIMLGVFLIFLIEYLDRTIKTEVDIEKYLDINTIGEIPEFEGEDRYISKNPLFKKKKRKKVIDRTRTSKALIALLNPKSPASEAYRSLRTNIGYSSIDQKVKTVVFTSSAPGEGKSTTIANLAITMAQVGKKVLILEGDLRKPRLHTYFSLNNDYGVTDVVVKGYSPKDVIKPFDPIDNLHIICSGAVPPNPTELLESKKMLELIETVKDWYDLVLIDMPPVGQLTDAAIIGRNVDGVILVVSSGESNIDMAKYSKSALDRVNARVLGAVLTKINGASSGAYYYRYNNYSQYYYEK